MLICGRVFETPQSIEYMHNDFRYMAEAMEKSNLALYSWFRTVIVGASSLLGILVSLQNDFQAMNEVVLYMCTIGLLSGGILLSGVVLSNDYMSQLRTARKHQETIRSPHNNAQTSRIETRVGSTRTFVICRISAFFFYASALLALVLYAAVKALNAVSC